jgi:hypothetical protein
MCTLSADTVLPVMSTLMVTLTVCACITNAAIRNENSKLIFFMFLLFLIVIDLEIESAF